MPEKRTRTGPVDPRLLRYARSSRGFFLAAGALSVARVAATIAFAWLLTAAITGVLDRTDGLARTLMWLGVVVLVRAALVWADERVAAGAASRVGSELRLALLAAIRRLGPSWLARRNSSALTVTAGHGLEALDVYVGRFLPQLVATVIITPVLLVVMWGQDWISGLTAVICLPLIPLFMALIGLATRSVQQKQWRTLQRLATRFADTVSGLGTLRLFGRERKAVASVESISDGYRRETMTVLRITFVSGFMLEFLASISVAIIAVSIGLRMLNGEMALSVGLFVLLLAPEAFFPVRQVGVQFHAATEGLAATADVFSVLDEAAAVSPADDAVAGTPEGPGVLALIDVRVQRDEPLPPVSFTARPGTVTVLRGPSGAGKSSVVAALRRAAEFTGTATLDGIDLRHLSPASWLAWADQRPGLIAGTVAANVALGDDAPAADDVAWALRTACSDADPDRELGAQGAGLSGGQAQRVAVARALYRHRRGAARVIVLDEPSSALDAHTEARLWRELRGVADRGATVVVVSHRSTAESIADDVVLVAGAEARS
ncbi:thiol reductant ABC exporter subunit CydD [Microbacterium gorillae]|uniref:thiol reductant ABC exporter subunit CydD n=1 Tax=Microbacterium gorillae TaxID=1231063 RepID=UPI00058ABF04|nr:thiol reductant ABC exporter subunit CydD [Microbacterium gorillae]